MSLWNAQLIVVTGKGGVGRTTLSCALAHAAASVGKRACVAELYGLDHIPQVYGLTQRSYTPQRVANGVDTMSLTPFECMSDFGKRKLKIGALSRLIFDNRVARAFLDGVPGLHDLVQLGKIENLLSEPLPGDPLYDVIVLDAPATGHGTTLLNAARAMREMTRVGPFAELAEIIETFLDDASKTRFILATLPEELPASESLQFIQTMGSDQGQLDAFLVNQVRPAPLPPEPAWEEVASLLAHLPDLVSLVEQQRNRFSSEQAVLQRLTHDAPAAAGHPLPVVPLPRLRGSIDVQAIDRLAAALLEHL